MTYKINHPICRHDRGKPLRNFRFRSDLGQNIKICQNFWNILILHQFYTTIIYIKANEIFLYF